MNKLQILKSALIGGASVAALVHPAAAKVFNVPDGDLANALVAYMKQSNVELVYVDNVVRGHKTSGAKGDYTETAALTQILRGTGFTAEAMSPNTIGIVPEPRDSKPRAETIRVAAAAPRTPAPGAVETVVVTAQHKSEDIQQVPIAITALSQQQLTDRQIAGGPDLLRDVPNMDFTKTNFSGYDIELRGIGTQAISVTTDPAVAVAFNDTPFIRNHFFEQEFFDLQDVEVLLGPQGTLYGRNATAGVVNLKSALPTDQYEAMLSADLGNYNGRRLEGMINIPIVSDQLDIRFAGEWTKRDGYTEDTTLNTPVDGRDLWSGRMTIGWNPTSNFHSDFIWEHFSEDDDRLRSGKQLCKTDPYPTTILGVNVSGFISLGGAYSTDNLSQGCEMTSLYSPSAFEVPNGFALPYYTPFESLGFSVNPNTNPYAETTQSTNLRQIQSTILPTYRAKNDTVEFNANYKINNALTLTSQTGFNHDFLWSTEDYNRFDSAPGAFINQSGFYYSNLGITLPDPAAGTNGIPADSGVFCDPQLGCSDRLVAEDLDEEHAWQASQEFRLASNFGGPFNFSLGANYLHYETEEDYYVFINSLSLASASLNGEVSDPFVTPYVPGVSNNAQCLEYSGGVFGGFRYNPTNKSFGTAAQCVYIDPNPIGSLNNEGHNYYLNQNPYTLNSYAAFGEAYYNITSNLKLTTGLRWTDDQKHFTEIPSELLVNGYGYPSTGVVNQQWDQWTGRAVIDWSPTLPFTDQSLFYASYAHGYKAGGANPPGPVLTSYDAPGTIVSPDHPLTFKPEFIEAFELGTKNTLFDDSLTLNGDIFYYNYTGYQISEIVDRTAINNNYNAHVEGAEVTANWEPIPGLKFNFAGGWEDTAAAGGDQGIDLMDRTAGNPNWMVVQPFPTQSSNCILPAYLVLYQLQHENGNTVYDCGQAYENHQDPVTGAAYVANPSTDFDGNPIAPGTYPGFNPATAPNNGEGFDKNLTGHALPNAPPFTVSLGGEYSMPVTEDWVATLRSDFYWQADSWARIFNDNPYDRLEGYTNVNVAVILTSANGWQVMGYVKNVFNVTAITGDFLNSDDSGLTTNVFLTDPRLFGVRVTKHLDQGDGFWGESWSGADFFADLFSDKDGGKPPVWVELGIQSEQLSAIGNPFNPPFATTTANNGLGSLLKPQEALTQSVGGEAKVSYQAPDSDWIVSASVRYGRANGHKDYHYQTPDAPHYAYFGHPPGAFETPLAVRFADEQASNHETHAIIDFQIGKDMDLGKFGDNDTSVLGFGVRFAQFATLQGATLHADPDAYFPSNQKYFRHHHTYSGVSHIKHSFHGIGPSISWTGTAPVLGNADGSGLDFDWGANGAVLFGRQSTQGHHESSSIYFKRSAISYPAPVTGHSSANPDRSRTVVVPNLGGMAGVSYRFNNAKLTLGYRADFFFGAMDAGIDAHRNETLGFFGPFANISIGLGG